MAMLTVVGDKLAKKGITFVFHGPLSECKECKVKNICFHLERGRWYKITGVRGVHHDCKVHEDGVEIVEVEKMPIEAAVDKRLAMDGSTISFEAPKCAERGCENYRLCFPLALSPGDKLKVLKSGKKIKCPANNNRVKVVLE